MFANMKLIHIQKSSHFAWLVKKSRILETWENIFCFLLFRDEFNAHNNITKISRTRCRYRMKCRRNWCTIIIVKSGGSGSACIRRLSCGIRIPFIPPLYNIVQVHLHLKRFSQESETAVQWVFIVAVSVKCIFVLAPAASRGGGGGQRRN